MLKKLFGGISLEKAPPMDPLEQTVTMNTELPGGRKTQVVTIELSTGRGCLDEDKLCKKVEE